MSDESPEGVNFVQWPMIVIENSAREIERLRSILQRQLDLFDRLDLGDLVFVFSVLTGEVGLTPNGKVMTAQKLLDMAGILQQCSGVLAELDPLPPDLEGEDDGD